MMAPPPEKQGRKPKPGENRPALTATSEVERQADMQRIACAVLVSLSLASPAWAEPIRIVSGAFELQTSQIASLTMTGDSRGFTWQSTLPLIEGFFGPDLYPHPGGVPVDLGAGWVGRGIQDATATLDGQTFTDIGGLSPISPSARLSFSGLAPQLPMSGSVATLLAPFVFDGTFSHSAMEELTGYGTATLTYNFIAGQFWQLSEASYVFEGDTMHAPEPASLLLVATGLAYGIRRRFTRDHDAQRG